MSSVFLRVFQHLLPRSPAWALSFNKTLKKFFAGLAAPLDDSDPTKSPRAYADAIFYDAFPLTTRQPSEWVAQFGLESSPDTDVAQALTAAWQAQGGQSPGYIQGVIQSAGFDLYIHEWWSSGPPFVARDPRTYTQHPLIGLYQCTPLGLPEPKPACTPSPLLGQPECTDFLGNEIGYLVNKDLTQRSPPAVPDDPNSWPYFFYLGGAAFPDRVSIPASRRAELERLVLKLRPTHLWVVMLVDYVADDDSVTVGGVPVVAGGVPVVITSALSVTAGGSTVTVGGVPVSASA